MDLRRLLNREGNDAQPQPRDANTAQLRLGELLRSYDQEGGSNAVDLWDLRRRFATIIPFDDPLFLPKFSDFGLSARELDEHRGRNTFQLGGFIPPPGLPVDQTPPVVLHPDAFRDFRPRENRPPPQLFLRPPPAGELHGHPRPPPIPPRLPPINPLGPGAQFGPVGATAAAAFNTSNRVRPELPPLRNMLNPLGLGQDDILDPVANLRSPSRKKRHKRKHNRRASKRKRGRRNREASSSSSTSSLSSSSESPSDSEDAADNLPFTKGKNRISGPLPSPAQAIADGITLYKKAGWAVSVDRFNLEVNRPLGFPFSLVPALLRGHYICPAKVLCPDEYDSKKSPKPTDTFTSIRHFFPAERDWRRIIALIGDAVVFAFPSTEDDMRSYLEHIYDMLALFAEQGDWSQIVDYDARLRLAFATRPALSFGDFNSPSLLAVRTIATTTGFARQRPPTTHAPHTHSPQLATRFQQHSQSASSARPSRETTHAPRRKSLQAATPRHVWHGNIKPSKPAFQPPKSPRQRPSQWPLPV